MGRSREERWERFWETLCSLYGALWLGFALNIVLLVLSLFSFLYVERDSPTYVILQVDLVVLTITFVGLAIPLYRCSQE